MFASPVVDTSKMENLEHEDWLAQTDMESMRYFSIGTLQRILHSAGQKKSEAWQNKVNADNVCGRFQKGKRI